MQIASQRLAGIIAGVFAIRAFDTLIKEKKAQSVAGISHKERTKNGTLGKNERE
ncbi:MAG: hypothetical protein LBI02_02205 [Opitutaceae bacterium]|jgi:hypothetical protein|nr:hypothetical protein [Opitutaceae bacterium]